MRGEGISLKRAGRMGVQCKQCAAKVRRRMSYCWYGEASVVQRRRGCHDGPILALQIDGRNTRSCTDGGRGGQCHREAMEPGIGSNLYLCVKLVVAVMGE